MLPALSSGVSSAIVAFGVRHDDGVTEVANGVSDRTLGDRRHAGSAYKQGMKPLQPPDCTQHFLNRRSKPSA